MTVAVPARQAEIAALAEPVGDLIAHALAEIGVTTVFGVISIHNMPILDAIARQGRIRFVPARGEAGAMNMADAYARVSRSLGVVITSTGTAAGNAAGSQVEALTAGSPVLHITSQIDRPYMDRDRAAIHDVPRQADMLRAVSKAYFRVWEGRTAVAHGRGGRARRAHRAARSGLARDPDRRAARKGRRARAISASGRSAPQAADPKLLDELAELVRARQRPMLWLGGGAREAAAAAHDLAERGFAVVTSTNGWLRHAIRPQQLVSQPWNRTCTPCAGACVVGASGSIVDECRHRGPVVPDVPGPYPVEMATKTAVCLQPPRSAPTPARRRAHESRWRRRRHRADARLGLPAPGDTRPPRRLSPPDRALPKRRRFRHRGRRRIPGRGTVSDRGRA